MAGNPRIEELRKKLEKEPGSRLFAQLAEELRKEGEFEDAIRVAREGLQKHANYPSARMTLGRALFDTGDFAAARVEFEQVLKGAPDNILASRLLAESLEGLGDVPGAVARYKKTLALAPGDKQVTARLEALEKGGGASSAPAAAVPPPRTATAIRPGAPAVVAAPPIPVEPPTPVDSSAPIRLVDVDAPMELERPNEGPSSFDPGPIAASSPPPPAPAPAAPGVAGPPSGAEGAPPASPEPAPIPLVAAEEDFEIERPNEPRRPAASEPPPASARAAEAAAPAPPPPSHEAAMEFDFDAGPTGSTIPFAPAPAPAPADAAEPAAEVRPEPEPEPEPERAPEPVVPQPVVAAPPIPEPLRRPPPPPVPVVEAAEVRTAVVAPPPPPEPATTVEVPWSAQPAAPPPPPAPSPVEPPAGGDTPADALMSATLAELYFNQGFTDKAVEVYRQLLEREPDNERLRRRFTELQAPPAPTAPPATASAPVGEPASVSAPAPAARPAAPSAADDTASRRLALERTIARLEGMLAAIKKG